MSEKPILDACCGSRMFWFDKKNPNVTFCDNRTVPYHEYYKKRYLEIKPDIVCDFTALPFADKSFKLVVFDPPHLTWAGPKSWMALKYGCLQDNWPQMLHDGFHECMRVLDDNGVLIFKWSEVQIPLRDILKAIEYEPLFGHRSGKHNNTHWMCFMKNDATPTVTNTCEYTLHEPKKEGYNDKGFYYKCTCGVNYINIELADEWLYCPYCGKQICGRETYPCNTCVNAENDCVGLYCVSEKGKYKGENVEDANFDGCKAYERAEG